MLKLNNFSYNRFSQFGEDGIIEKIFTIMKPASKVCIEFGAWDGYHFSNTANLWTNGWNAVLIEANLKKYEELVKNTKNYNCVCINEFVTTQGDNSIEYILEKWNIKDEIDYLSIDIDGDDYYILEGINDIKPHLISCEYNPTIPADQDLIPQKNNYFGCSAKSLCDLAAKKGYKLIAVTDTNCFFVLEEYFQLFDDYQTNLLNLRIDNYLTYVYSGYDGKYVLSGRPVYGFTIPEEIDFFGNYFKPKPNRASIIKQIKGKFYYWLKRK